MDPLEFAKRLANSVEDEARRIGIAVSFCAVDMHGNLILKQRMTGAKLISIEMAERKAYTAAALLMKTAEMTPLSLPGQGLHTLASIAGGRFTVFGGGIPVSVDGKLVAGVGVSGGTTEQDIEVVESAVNRIVK